MLLPIYIWGENVKGKIVDIRNEPVMFAKVILLNDSIFIKGTMSDETGSFNIEIVPEVNFIKFSCIGYEDCIYPIDNREDLGNIILQESYTMLDEVLETV